MCGTALGGRQVKGKALQKSPPGKTKGNKSCKDMSTQTNESSVLHKKEVHVHVCHDLSLVFGIPDQVRHKPGCTATEDG